MFRRDKKAAILAVLLLLAAVITGTKTHSTEQIVNKSNNNATVLTTHLDSFTLPFNVSSVASSSHAIETANLDSSTLPIEPASWESSTFPTEAVSEENASWTTETSTGTKTSATPKITSTQKTSVCVDGWVEREGFGACYFVSTDAVVWLDARNTCHNLVASLVSIHSEDENRFVRSLVNNETDYWIGMTADSLRHDRWNDESHVMWTNWQNPSVQPFGNWCGLLLTRVSSVDSKWRQSVCLFNKPFICKKVLYAPMNDKEDKIWLCTSVAAGSVVLLVFVLTALAIARKRRQTDVRMPPPSVTDIRAVATHCGSRQYPDGRLPDELSLSFECRYAWSTENIYSTVDDDITSCGGYEHLGHRPRTENIYEPTYWNVWPGNLGSDNGGRKNNPPTDTQ